MFKTSSRLLQFNLFCRKNTQIWICWKIEVCFLNKPELSNFYKSKLEYTNKNRFVLFTKEAPSDRIEPLKISQSFRYKKCSKLKTLFWQMSLSDPDLHFPHPILSNPSSPLFTPLHPYFPGIFSFGKKLEPCHST